MKQRILNYLNRLGPSILAIGFTIGTGSVTSMIVSGSRYGMDLWWVLLLSCLFSWACIEAYGRYYIVTGDTALYAFKKRLRYGKAAAWLIMIGLTFGQWNSLMGNLTITSNAIFETLNIFWPSLSEYSRILVLVFAIINVGTIYLILNTGRFHLFEKVLQVIVSVMAMSFLFSIFIVLPNPVVVAKGLIPSIPEVAGASRLIIVFVGTTMAAATFLSRPLFIQTKGWGIQDRALQSKDALNASFFIFLISSAIMIISVSTLYEDGKSVEKVLDMVGTLEPIAGKFALVIFLTGTLSAGLSSIFPIMMIAPLMYADYSTGKLDMNSRFFKIITAITAVIGLIGPALGGNNPIEVQLFTQVFLVLVLPLVVLMILILINNKKIMGEHKAGWILNTGLILAFLFSCLIAIYGTMDIIETFKLWMGYA